MFYNMEENNYEKFEKWFNENAFMSEESTSRILTKFELDTENKLSKTEWRVLTTIIARSCWYLEKKLDKIKEIILKDVNVL